MSGHDHDHDHGHGLGHDHGHGHGPSGGHGHDHHHGHGTRDQHGNPQDFDAYLARLQDPERLAWQKPDEVVAALGLRPGQIACDLGAGPGVFALRLARAVGPAGRVHAIDVEPRMIEVLRHRAREEGVANVNPILAGDGDVALPPEPCDAILVVNAFHHFPDGAGTLRRLAGALTPGGVVANVDFHARELPVGPPPEHKLSREDFVKMVAAAGLQVVKEPTFLPYQYFFVMQRGR